MIYNKSSKEILEFIHKKGLLDIWRIKHPNTEKYTWHRPNPQKFGRLDFFLISDTLLPLYADSKILSNYRSDHTTISLEIYIQKTPGGPDFWKINNSHPLNSDLQKIIRDEILISVQTYACTPYHPDYVLKFFKGNIDLMIDIRVFCDTIHALIRGRIISYAGRKKRIQNMEENKLNKKNRDSRGGTYFRSNGPRKYGETKWL